MTTPAPPLRYDVSELLKSERRTVEINREDRCRSRLAWRDSSRVNQSGNVADPANCLDEACTDSRDEMSTVAMLRSNPASSRTPAAASAFSMRRSGNTTCFPALTRRAIA
jgi:hypothetical protein